MSKPYALKVTFTKVLSPTSLAYLETKQGTEYQETWMKVFLEEAQRFALEYVTQWIADGSVVPTVAIVDDVGEVHGEELKRKVPRKDVEGRPY